MVLDCITGMFTDAPWQDVTDNLRRGGWMSMDRKQLSWKKSYAGRVVITPGSKLQTDEDLSFGVSLIRGSTTTNCFYVQPREPTTGFRPEHEFIQRYISRR